MTMHWSPLNFTPATWLLVAALVVVDAGEALGSSGGKSKEKPAAAKAEHKEPKAAHEPKEAIPEAKADELRGVEIGEYRIRSDYPAEAQKCTVRFKLYVSIRGDKLAKMSRLIEEHQQKIRDEVITSTRLSSLGKLEEPDLKSLRRRIVMRLKRSMPELVFEDLYVSDFAMTVKSL